MKISGVYRNNSIRLLTILLSVFTLSVTFTNSASAVLSIPPSVVNAEFEDLATFHTAAEPTSSLTDFGVQLPASATSLLNLEVLRIPNDYENVHVLGSFDDGLGNVLLFDFINPAIVVGDIDPMHWVTITSTIVGPTHIDKFHVFSYYFGPYDLFGPATLPFKVWLPISLTTSITLGQISVSIEPVPEPATICLLGLGGLALLRRKRGYGA